MIAKLELIDGGIAELDDAMPIMERAFDPAFGEAWTRAQCLGMLTLPGVWLSIAREADLPVGFALTRIVLDEAELLLLGVDPARQRRGIGDALLRHAMATAGAKGARLIHLEVRDGNAAASLYDRTGLHETGRRREYYRGHDGRLYDAISLSCAIDLG